MISKDWLAALTKRLNSLAEELYKQPDCILGGPLREVIGGGLMQDDELAHFKPLIAIRCTDPCLKKLSSEIMEILEQLSPAQRMAWYLGSKENPDLEELLALGDKTYEQSGGFGEVITYIPKPPI